MLSLRKGQFQGNTDARETGSLTRGSLAVGSVGMAGMESRPQVQKQLEGSRGESAWGRQQKH